MRFLKQTILCVSALFFLSSVSFGQKKIIIEGSKDQPYFDYVVKTGESLSSISKKFATDVPTIMRLNNFNNKSKLAFGKAIKVPFSPAILTQNEAAPTAVVHKVVKGENLYRISLNHNKVDLELLKKWNKLAPNAIVDEGQEIIVGYVNFKAPAAANTEVAKNEKAEPIKKEEVKQTKAEEVYNLPPTKEIKEEKKDPIKEEKKPEEKPLQKEEPKVETPRVNKAVQKENEKPAANTSVVLKQESSTAYPEGYFAREFGKNVEGRELATKTGTAMTFKTASGWTDKKYYILINDIPPGSIVKISNGGSKVVYAKVLWNLGGIKENEGLDFRISNAAAAVLGISDAKFPLIVTVYE